MRITVIALAMASFICGCELYYAAALLCYPDRVPACMTKDDSAQPIEKGARR